jgi:hypothetical protein
MKYIGNYKFLLQKNNRVQKILSPWSNLYLETEVCLLTPGKIFPMTTDSSTEKKYWVAKTDYVPGHIFIYGDIMIKNYRIGDVYEYTNENKEYGSANISLSNFVFLNLIEINE